MIRTHLHERLPSRQHGFFAPIGWRYWLSIAGCYGHVQAERPKTINRSRGRVRHPAFAILGKCQSYKSRGALCPIILRALHRSLNLHHPIPIAILNWQRESKGSMKPPKTCSPCMKRQSNAWRMFRVQPQVRTGKPVATISHRERCSMSANY